MENESLWYRALVGIYGNENVCLGARKVKFQNDGKIFGN